METLFGVMVPITLFAGLFLTIVFLRKYENDERMALIEKGMDPRSQKKSNRFGTLRFSLLTIGVGLGIITGLIITQLLPDAPMQETMQIIEDSGTEIHLDSGNGVDGAIYGGSILVFGGAGLLLAYLINKKKPE